MKHLPRVRHVRESDIPALTRIYNHYIEQTHITFHTKSYAPDERLAWFKQFSDAGHYPLLVLEGEELLGYAHATAMNPRKAYETSVETTIYLAPEKAGQGHGTLLYSALIEHLENEDLHRAYALISLPNDISIALHEKFGFKKVSHLHEVGRKFGRYYDVIWMERDL